MIIWVFNVINVCTKKCCLLIAAWLNLSQISRYGFRLNKPACVNMYSSSNRFVYVVYPQTKMKTSALEEIKKVLEEELEEPLRLLKQLLEPFQQAYDFFIQTVKNIKEAWRVIRNGCESDVHYVVIFHIT